MIKTIGLLAFVACFCASAEITVTREGSTDWICADADGVPLSNHTRIDKAFEACTNRTLADGLVYRVVAGSTYRIQSDGVAIAPDPVDSDGDGVNDDVDQCPGTTQGVEVDAVGCEIIPPDADGDGIPDAEDECPNDATNTCNDPPPPTGDIPAVATAQLDKTIYDCVAELASTGNKVCQMRVSADHPSLSAVFPAGLNGKLHGTSGPGGILDLWTGAAFDSENLVMTFMGGGHNGYRGNDNTSLYLKTGKIIRHNDPDTFEALYFESSGYHCWLPVSDDENIPSHTYGLPLYDPASGLIFVTSSVMSEYHACIQPSSPDFDENDPRLKPLGNNTGIYAINLSGEVRYGIQPGDSKRVFQGVFSLSHARGFIHPDGDIVVGGWNEVWKGRMNPETNMLDLDARHGPYFPSAGHGTQHFNTHTNTSFYSTNSGVFEYDINGTRLSLITKTAPGGLSATPYKDGSLVGYDGAATLSRFYQGAWYIYDIGAEGMQTSASTGRLYSKWRYIDSLDVGVAVIDKSLPVVVIKIPEDIADWTPLEPVSAQNFINEDQQIPPGNYVGGVHLTKPGEYEFNGVRLLGGVQGKGKVLVDGGPVVINNLSLHDRYQCEGCAGVRGQLAPNITLNNFQCSQQENCILTGNGGGRVVINGGDIRDNFTSFEAGKSHGIYIGVSDYFESNNVDYGCYKNLGHSLKSRAAVNKITGGSIDQGDCNSSAIVDFPNPGKHYFTNLVVTQSPNSDNHDLFRFAREYPGDVTVTWDHVIVNADRSDAVVATTCRTCTITHINNGGNVFSGAVSPF